MVWYSHLFQNFPQFDVIHSVKGFGIVNTAEIDDFLELSWFFHELVPIHMYGMHSSWYDDEGSKKKDKKRHKERTDFEMVRDLYIVSKIIEQKEVWGF